MKYPKLNLGQMEALVNRLGGMEAVKKILGSPDVEVKHISELEVWLMFHIGIPTNAKDYIDRLNNRATERAVEMIKKIRRFEKESTFLDLVVRRVRDLNVSSEKDATYDYISERAVQSLYDLCPPEVGPKLREHFHGTLSTQMLYIASQPIWLTDGSQNIFTVSTRKEKDLLDAYEVGDHVKFKLDDLIVLKRRSN